MSGIDRDGKTLCCGVSMFLLERWSRVPIRTGNDVLVSVGIDVGEASAFAEEVFIENVFGEGRERVLPAAGGERDKGDC